MPSLQFSLLFSFINHSLINSRDINSRSVLSPNWPPSPNYVDFFKLHILDKSFSIKIFFQTRYFLNSWNDKILHLSNIFDAVTNRIFPGIFDAYTSSLSTSWAIGFWLNSCLFIHFIFFFRYNTVNSSIILNHWLSKRHETWRGKRLCFGIGVIIINKQLMHMISHIINYW